jgi:hypothetical protein
MHIASRLRRSLRQMPKVRRLAVEVRDHADSLGKVWRGTQRTAAASRQSVRRLIPVRLPQHVAQVRYAAVLDGHTLNLDIEVPAAGPQPPSGVTLVLTAGQRRLSVPARIRSVTDGVARVSATVVLGERGLPVHEKPRWLIDCVLRDQAGASQTYALCGAPPPPWPDGPTVPAPRCSRSGMLFRPETGPGGRTTLVVHQPKHSVQIVALRVGWVQADLTLRTVGFTCTEAPELRLTCRTDRRSVTVRASVDGDRLRCALPVGSMTSEAGVDESIWDVHLLVQNKRMAVGSTLHDLEHPKGVIRLQDAIVSAEPGVAVRVRPYVTPTGRLAVACLRISSLGGVPARAGN